MNFPGRPAIAIGMFGVAIVFGCGGDEPADANDPLESAAQPPPPAEIAAEPTSEATLAHAYLVAWHRCALTTRHRIEQSWSRYTVDFKNDIGHPRSKDIAPFVYRITPTRQRCLVPQARPATVPEEVQTEGVAYLDVTDVLAAHFDGLAANFETDAPDLEAVAESGATFFADHQAWSAASTRLEAQLDAARDQADAVWMKEVEADEGKQLRWLVADVVRAGRGLRVCIGAAPKDPPCAAALESFGEASGTLGGHCRSNPDARLGAFWLDVLRSKVDPVSVAAHASQDRKPPRRKPEAFNTAHWTAIGTAMDELVLAGDRVRFDFP